VSDPKALAEARREARVDATLFILVAAALLVLLAVMSSKAGWELLGLHGWVWLLLCIPEALLIGALFLSARSGNHLRERRALEIFITLVVLGSLTGLSLLTAALLTESTSDLTGAQLLLSGTVLWLTNVVAFGLAFWTLDCGGAVNRALHGRAKPDFQFPQDENPGLARPGWYPRLEDYVYGARTNGIAFSPTDAMPLTRQAKALMALESVISVGAVLLVAARAVNVLGA
jgi:hypothetical protein